MGLFAAQRFWDSESEGARRLLQSSRRIRAIFHDPLRETPLPLLDPDRGLLVIWSAKSACSLTYVWYLKIVGLLDDFSASGAAPHQYRMRRYPRSDAFLRGLGKVVDDYHVVHVIRDPYLRAVSCYRHALAHNLVDRHVRHSRDGGRSRQGGFSFSSYLDFLESLDVAHTNVHHRQQLHSLERIKPADRVINISKGRLLEDLNRLEEEIGLPPTDFTAFGSILGREEGRKAKTAKFEQGGVADYPFEPPAAHGHALWPDYNQFLTAETRRRIERIYAADFAAFGPYL